MDQFGVWGLITRKLVHTLRKTGGKRARFLTTQQKREGGGYGWNNVEKK